MSDARLSSKGQIAIPRDIHERLKLKLGDKLRFRIADDGQVVVKAARYHIGERYRLLRRKGQKPVSVETTDEAIHRPSRLHKVQYLLVYASSGWHWPLHPACRTTASIGLRQCTAKKKLGTRQ